MKLALMPSMMLALFVLASQAFAFGKAPPPPANLPDQGLPDASNPASNTGPQDVAVVILDYPGTPDLALKPDVSVLGEIFQGSLGGVSISDFFAKASEGKVAFRSFKIFGPYHLNETIYCDQEEKIWKLGVEAASADVNFLKFSRVTFIMPRPMPSDSCDFWGKIAVARSELQCLDTDTPEGKRCLNFNWIGWQAQMQGQTSQDDFVFSKYFMTKLMTHEMLHGWNLMHNNTYSDSFHDVIPGVNQEVNRIEYGDSFPIMSSSGTGNPVGWMTGAQLVRLDWLNPDEWADVQTDGTFEIAPLAYGKSGLKVLRIPRKAFAGDDPGDYLWVEYREALSAYDHIPGWPVGEVETRQMGVVVHETSQALTDGETVLLRFNAADAPDAIHADYRLPAVWQDPYTGVKLELLGTAPEHATIRVSFK